MARLELENVSKRFGSVPAVDGVDLKIEHGEFVVFVGPSGCGKSTLLRMISGLESVTAGRILIGGRDVTNVAPSRRGVAMVFQSYALFPHMTAAENIGFGLRLAKVAKDEIARRVEEVAATLQIEPLLGRYPRELSGGQRQRVAIGRSIIRDPQVFLFDEPLSNLDAALRVRMRLEIARLRNRLDATMVYVTHDQTEAMTLADRIAVFNHGRIEQVGVPLELYDAPANRFVAGFIGAPAMNFIPAVIEATEGGEAQVRFGPVSLPAGRLRDAAPGPVTFGVRPEHLAVTSATEADFRGRVEIVERLGVEALAYIQTDFSAEPVTIRISAQQGVRPGDELPVRVERERFHLFCAAGTAIRHELLTGSR